VAAASLLSFALTLPPLSGAWVTRWRRAAAQSLIEPGVVQAALAQNLRLAQGDAASGAVQGTQADPAAEIALRGWLESRLKWRPS
jgi:glucose-6-phosphate dehydrogenase assembly protein OpcA